MPIVSAVARRGGASGLLRNCRRRRSSSSSFPLLLLRGGGGGGSVLRRGEYSAAAASSLIAGTTVASSSSSMSTGGSFVVAPLSGGASPRWHSTASSAAAASESSSSEASCPYAASSAAAASSSSAPSHPELVRVPSLPYVGSMIPRHSGVPPDPLRPYEFWTGMRERFGDFYAMGLPVIGNTDPEKGGDRRAVAYVVHDPREMVKVVRSEGAYPSGLLPKMWPNRKYLAESGFVVGSGEDGGFLGEGPGWKRLRTFLQTDLLHPEAARGYIPGMVEAARLASRGAPASSSKGGTDGDFIPYLNRCAFDMFNTIMFGELTRTADPHGTPDAENLKFVDAASSGVTASLEQLRHPFEILVGKVMGFETERYRTMRRGYETTWNVSRKKVKEFLRLKGEGKLDANQTASYLARAVDRQASKEGNRDGITMREMEELVFTGLFAAVDTTSATLAWNVLHLALNPGVQDKLHEELRAGLDAAGDGDDDEGKRRRLNAAVLDRSASPYLRAVVRESHRITPIGPHAVFKSVGSGDGMDIHGVRLPEGSVVALCGYPIGNDPNLVDDPDRFVPERWYPDAVERRRGTPSEVVDHPYFRDAFSQGPRKCPAARVAANEILVMVSQLVLDYRISTATKDMTLKDVEYEMQTAIQPIMPPLRFEPRV